MQRLHFLAVPCNMPTAPIQWSSLVSNSVEYRCSNKVKNKVIESYVSKHNRHGDIPHLIVSSIIFTSSFHCFHFRFSLDIRRCQQLAITFRRPDPKSNAFSCDSSLSTNPHPSNQSMSQHAFFIRKLLRSLPLSCGGRQEVLTSSAVHHCSSACQRCPEILQCWHDIST